MKVKAIWEFEFDDSDLCANFVDVDGLAKDTAKCELMFLLRKRQLTSDDFEYVVEKKEEIVVKDPVGHAEWKLETVSFSHNPTKTYVHHECSNCCTRYRTEGFDTDAWEAYHKHHFNPKLPNFCPECGYKMDLRYLYEQYKYRWCANRGYILEDVDDSVGINGECYACFDEWYQNEYLESRGE